LFLQIPKVAQITARKQFFGFNEGKQALPEQKRREAGLRLVE
jgi:hypothetical protein